MAAAKVKERQTEYWTSRAIENFFHDEGYEVSTFPLSGVTEGELPLDYVFWSPRFAKMFGIQYKALYGNGDEHWPIDVAQLAALKNIPWAAYSLSEMDDPRQWRSALHRQAIVFPAKVDLRPGSVRIERRDLGERIRYARWGGFIEMIERCQFGFKVDGKADLRAELNRLVQSPNRELLQMVDLFVADKEERKVLHLDPIMKDIPPNRPVDDTPGLPPSSDRATQIGRSLRGRR